MIREVEDENLEKSTEEEDRHFLDTLSVINEDGTIIKSRVCIKETH